MRLTARKHINVTMTVSREWWVDAPCGWWIVCNPTLFDLRMVRQIALDHRKNCCIEARVAVESSAIDSAYRIYYARKASHE